MLFAILTFLIVGSMVGGYCLRVARLEKQYDDTDQTIDELIAALNVERKWTKSLQADAIKKQTYTPRTTRTFSKAKNDT